MSFFDPDRALSTFHEGDLATINVGAAYLDRTKGKPVYR
jgi:hypothetical protein